MTTFSEQFPIVFQALNVGFLQTLKLFFVTLIGAIPLGLIISFGSMSRWSPLGFLRPYLKNLPKDGTLTKWAERGVLMLNTTLTVRRGQANSHKNLGWTTFTDHIIEKLNEHEQPIVFLLWGGNARSKKKLITAPQHLVLESVHPSPLSAYNGFFGCKHFSKCNAFLEAHGIDPIDWDLNH